MPLPQSQPQLYPQGQHAQHGRHGSQPSDQQHQSQQHQLSVFRRQDGQDRQPSEPVQIKQQQPWYLDHQAKHKAQMEWINQQQQNKLKQQQERQRALTHTSSDQERGKVESQVLHSCPLFQHIAAGLVLPTLCHGSVEFVAVSSFGLSPYILCCKALFWK